MVGWSLSLLNSLISDGFAHASLSVSSTVSLEYFLLSESALSYSLGAQCSHSLSLLFVYFYSYWSGLSSLLSTKAPFASRDLRLMLSESGSLLLSEWSVLSTLVRAPSQVPSQLFASVFYHRHCCLVL